jgi:hypothetical protein
LPSLRAVDQNFGEFVTQSGVFSAGAVDPASALLGRLCQSIWQAMCWIWARGGAICRRRL